MANDKVLLNDGSSFVLLNDGSSVVLLNSETVVAQPGLSLSGTHATQAYYSGTEQLHPLDFVFIIKASTTRKLKLSVGVKASFLSNVKSKATSLSSSILVETKYPFKLKSLLLKPIREKIGLRATLFKHYTLSLKLNTRKAREDRLTTRREVEKVNLKKALLKLIEDFEEDD